MNLCRPRLLGAVALGAALSLLLPLAPASADGTTPNQQPGAAKATRSPVEVKLLSKNRVRDERRIKFRIRWHTVGGRELNGKVRLQKKPRGKSWRTVKKVKITGGTGSIKRRPRNDHKWRVRTPARTHIRAGTSNVKSVDNVPRGPVVDYPRKAPNPRRKLPRQRRAVGKGLHAKTHRIGRSMWKQMKGRSWHKGCPVGRGKLRVVRMNYWGFDGYRYRGTMVVHKSITKKTRRTFSDLHKKRYPIRAMYRVDRFGWSKRLHGANDYKSMAADNTSAFNCRGVVGSPGRRSPHSYGRSIDVNPWENPYRSRRGLEPNSYWDHRRTPRRVVYRGGSHPVVKAFRRHGFGWMGSSDWQHFQYGLHGARLAMKTRGGFLD